MSGLIRWPVIEQVVLRCEVRTCGSRFVSPEYRSGGYGEPWTRAFADAPQRATAPAFEAGWRVFVGKRSQHTYCPEHGPTVPMRQVFPRSDQ